MSPALGHVFISYSRSDQATCQNLQQALERAGIDCWVDRSDIKPGAKWLLGVQKGLDKAKAMVVLYSEKAKESDYMEREFHAAEKLGLTIIPVIIEGETVPFHLTDLNAIFLQDNWQNGIDSLIEALRQDAPASQREAEQAWLNRLETKLKHRYIPLKAESLQSGQKSITIPDEMVQHAVLEHLAQRLAKAEPKKTMEYEDIQTVFDEVSRAVLLGEPGAGKSTALRKVASDALNRARAEPNAPIPLYISLGEWRQAEQSFASFLNQQLGPLGPYLQALLNEQRAWLLLDGLNEPPSHLRVEKAVELGRWLRDHPQLSCCVSCRDLDYTEEMRLELDTIRIRPLDPLRIRAFLQDYLPLMMGAPGKDAAESLFWELGGGEPLHQTWKTWQAAGASEEQFWCADEIPKENPDIYYKTTVRDDEIWQDARQNPHSLLRLAANPFMLSMLAVVYSTEEILPPNRAVLFKDFVDTLLRREGLEDQGDRIIAGLQSLAWAMQQQRESADVGVQTTLARDQALRHIDEITLQQAASANVLDAGDDIRFSHQLLQEYFTALTMRQRLKENTLNGGELWPVEHFWKPSGWEEATILLAGLYEADISPIFQWLLPNNPELLSRCIQGTSISADDDRWREPFRERWLPAMTHVDAYPEPAARASIGRALGNLNLDYRPGIGLKSNGLPDIDWIQIPSGKVTLEDKAGTFPVETFYLARYPITNAQFQAFIDDPEGYTHSQWWAELDAHPVSPKLPHWNEPNHPREAVTWFEAMAFCAWLSERLGHPIALPTEWQWQQAACSGKPKWEYPWGSDYQSGNANINETWDKVGPHNLGRTTAVGLYPQGNSRHGVSDLSGNVWEWCLNKYENPKQTQAGGKEDRVVRGGAWRYAPDYARASIRNNNDPDNRNNNLGFRVCCRSHIIPVLQGCMALIHVRAAQA